MKNPATKPLAASPLEHDFPLLRLIDGVRASGHEITRTVEERRADVARRTGFEGRPLDDLLARELVEEAAEKSALIGIGVALPFSIPFLGPIATTLLVVPGGAVWVTINEIELCYALAAAYRASIPEEKLRSISYWLVRLSNYDELQSRALKMGVTLTVRKLIEKLIAVGLTRAFAATAPRMMMGMMGRVSAPWYVGATAYLGVPVLAVLAWNSTQSAGERAIRYFGDEPARLSR